MAMSKKNYEAVAAVMRENFDCPLLDKATLEEVANDLAKVMAADNPRFDKARFLAACGVV